ncbi:hypothetical protein BS636_09135 [Acinetobacter sp. LoGeW2-3]|uniref:ABZJ_00895 family protein n=1 Tax=Acinetobacter sp. LoGeW2-3 TaxID=1808001 RepID=UPI000C0585D6|nr:ABZJ_00895 family protein [Acinetobacter sp. LoGeW2-3]ATO19804.1 hypothetical protein BS636_09135 [Acinetobacter sp. LoGeW2-3]
MSHYLKYFAAVYFALLVLVGMIVYWLNLGAIIFIPALIAAAFLSARHFVHQELRLPTPEEKKTLVWGSTIIAMTLGFIFIFVMIWLHPYTEEILRRINYTGRGPNSFIVAALIALHAGLFHIAYQGYSRYSLDKLPKKHA